MRALGARAEAGYTRIAHGIGNARDERSLGTDYHKTAAVLACKRRHGSRVLGIEFDVLAATRGTAVTRCNIELAATGRLCELCRERVLTTAAAQ